MARTEKQELLQGERYNRLTIISFSHLDKRHRKFYNVNGTPLCVRAGNRSTKLSLNNKI